MTSEDQSRQQQTLAISREESCSCSGSGRPCGALRAPSTGWNDLSPSQREARQTENQLKRGRRKDSIQTNSSTAYKMRIQEAVFQNRWKSYRAGFQSHKEERTQRKKVS